MPIKREAFAIILDDNRSRIVLQELDLTLELRHDNAEVAKILWQLLNATVVTATAELVDWDTRNELPVKKEPL